MNSEEEELQIEDLVIDKESLTEFQCRICFEILKIPR